LESREALTTALIDGVPAIEVLFRRFGLGNKGAALEYGKRRS
jgi:hypothetical protein